MKLIQDVSIGTKLQKIRVARGYSQTSLAKEFEDVDYPVSRDIIAKIEAGKYNIRISMLNRLLELYEVDYEDFFLVDKPVPPRKSEIQESKEKKKEI